MHKAASWGRFYGGTGKGADNLPDALELPCAGCELCPHDKLYLPRRQLRRNADNKLFGGVKRKAPIGFVFRAVFGAEKNALLPVVLVNFEFLACNDNSVPDAQRSVL